MKKMLKLVVVLDGTQVTYCSCSYVETNSSGDEKSPEMRKSDWNQKFCHFLGLQRIFDEIRSFLLFISVKGVTLRIELIEIGKNDAEFLP